MLVFKWSELNTNTTIEQYYTKYTENVKIYNKINTNNKRKKTLQIQLINYLEIYNNII